MISVEASVVCTVAVFVSVFVFCAACFLSDMNRIQAEAVFFADRAACAYGQCVSPASGLIEWDMWRKRGKLIYDLSEAEADVIYGLETNLKGELWGCTPDFSVDISPLGVTICYEGMWRAPAAINMFLRRAIPFEGSCVRKEPDNEDLVRVIGGIIRGLGSEDGD